MNDLNFKSSAIAVKTITPDDLDALVQLYQDVFSNYFLGHMGNKFLRLFCSQFINSTHYGYMAWWNGEPVGFLYGTLDTDELFSKFYKKHFLALTLIVLVRYLKDSFIRKNILSRFGHILKAITSFFGRPIIRPHTSSRKSVARIYPATLLAIGVSSHYRGSGIASLLTQTYYKDLKKDRICKVCLSAFTWNKRAIAFYKKDGWTEEYSNESTSRFSRNIKP